MPQIFSVDYNDLEDKWSVPKYRSFIRFNGGVNGNGDEFSLSELGALVNVSSGLYLKGYVDNGIPYVRVDNIRTHILNLSRPDLAFIDEKTAKEVVDRCRCRQDDILIARTGTLGKAVLVTKGHSGFVLSQHVSRISVRETDKTRPGFMCLYLNSDDGKSQLMDLGSGSTRLELTHTELRKLRVPTVGWRIQEEYHNRLKEALRIYYQSVNKLNALVEETNAFFAVKLEKKLKGKHSCFDVSTGNIGSIWFPKKYQPHITEAISLLLEQYDCPYLGEICDVRRGRGTRSSSYANQGLPYVRTSSIVNNSLDPFPDYYGSYDTYRKYAQPIDDEIILYSMEGKIGESALIAEDYPVVVKNHVEMLKLKQHFYDFENHELMGWLFLVLRSWVGMIQAEANTVIQSTIPGLASRLREYIIPIRSKSTEKNEMMRKLGNDASLVSREIRLTCKRLQELQSSFDSNVLQCSRLPAER